MTVPRSHRAGVSAPEAIVALLLGLFLVHLGLSTMARLRSAQVGLALRTDGLVAMRMGRRVLREELRRGRAQEDWYVSGDSISLRAFRGTALVCALDTASIELTVSYGGDRRPDPSKDSVLVISAEGNREVHALVGTASTAGPCGPAPSTTLETWRLDAAADPGTVLARLFEHGSYHLSAHALRYRRGASGRQPLTPEVWSPATAWTRSGNRLGLDVINRDSSAGRPWSAFLAWLE